MTQDIPIYRNGKMMENGNDEANNGLKNGHDIV